MKFQDLINNGILVKSTCPNEVCWGGSVKIYYHWPNHTIVTDEGTVSSIFVLRDKDEDEEDVLVFEPEFGEGIESDMIFSLDKNLNGRMMIFRDEDDLLS